MTMAMASRDESWTDSIVREAHAREIAGRLAWMNRLRLLAGLGLIAAASLAMAGMPDLPGGALAALGIAVLTVDAGHALVLRRLARRQDLPALRRLVGLEFWIDWGLLLALVRLTGGTQSPLLPFFVFHAILAAVLLDRRPGLAQCALALGLVTLLAALEHSGFRGPEPPAFLGIRPSSSLGHTGIRLAFFGAGIFLSFHLTHAIAWPLWQRTWDRQAAQQRRQVAIGRLHGLQRISETLTQDLSLDRVLQGLVHAVMESQRALGASLRLRDPETGALRLAASAGPLLTPVGEDQVDPARSPIDREVLRGRAVVISPDVLPDGVFSPLATTGIRSMAGVPLVHRGEVLGVLRVYFSHQVSPAPEDLSLLQAAAEAGASAIRNASAFQDLQRLEQVKSQYVFHLAHQLKSPLSAVRSTLSLLEEGFEGTLSEGFQASLREVRAHAPGTGLGLVLARRLAERNRGVMEIRSPAPESGTGTVVTIRIPVRSSEEVQ